MEGAAEAPRAKVAVTPPKVECQQGGRKAEAPSPTGATSALAACLLQEAPLSLFQPEAKWVDAQGSAVEEQRTWVEDLGLAAHPELAAPSRSMVAKKQVGRRDSTAELGPTAQRRAMELEKRA
jgi:hypothetical protein